MPDTLYTDVLIVGAGPVGTLIGLGLAQQGLDTLIVEKRERDVQAVFGRATTLYPRSLELLELLDLTKDLCQQGFVARNAVNYCDGQRINDRGWQPMIEPFRGSFHDYALNIRQKNSEEIFLTKYLKDAGKDVWFGWKLEGFTIDEEKGDGYNVSATLSHHENESVQLRCKYIVGADGGSSTVRRLANIPMEGSQTVYQWIRIDGKMSTSMPDADIGFAAIESPHHGNVLWIKLDEDAHRIGFALNESLLAKYPNGLTEEDAIKEAQESMKPFTLDIERLDWWTQYKITQNVAKTLQKDKYVLLAGDAAHRHSSGFAQGMNTGIHDALNLIWKLSGTLKGRYKPSVLATYSSERHAAAKHLIAIDQEASALISGDVPKKYASLGLSAHEVLSKVMVENMNFSCGLGVRYAPSFLNNPLQSTTLLTGSRAPDALVRGPGPNIPIRLMENVLNARPSSWTILVFAGYPSSTATRVSALREYLAGLSEQRKAMLRLATISASPMGNAWAAFGGPAVGSLYFDADGSAHAKYGVNMTSGAVVGVRPDGIVGFATGIEDVERITEYFDEISV